MKTGNTWTGAIIVSAMVVFLILIVSHRKFGIDGENSEIPQFDAQPKRFYLSSIKLKPKPEKKVILFWNKFFGLPHPEAKLNVSLCPVNNCVVTEDRSKAAESSAFIFHIVGGDLSANDLPANRQPHHLYVFYAYESPHNTGVDVASKPWPGFFNLTWTYRRDSDVFGDLYAREFRFTSWDKSTMEAKGKLDRGVALISNCVTNSGRERYLEELSKHFPVDIFGACGKSHPCTRDARSTCEKDLVRKYKFYFAFENSICKDYITEKAMRPLTYGSVPVVFGGGPYEKLLPLGSYVNAEDFESPKELGKYLSVLSRNPKIYRKFFDWRTNWTESKLLHDSKVSSICKLCEIVNEDTLPGQVYDDIDGWWRRDAHCRSWDK